MAVLVGATDASAQIVKWTDSGFVGVSAGIQASGQDIANTLTKDLYGETATIDAKRHIDGGLFFDASFGKRTWNNTGVGFTISHRSAAADVPITSSIPDPVFFDQPRIVDATLTKMKFNETLFAPIILMGFPVTDVIDAIGFLGPVVRSLHSEVVTDATIAENGVAAPTVTPTRTELSKNLLGVQIGVDLQYRLTPTLAAGGFLRYTGGGGHLNNDIKLDAPGLQLGVGVRYKFKSK